MNQVDPSTLTDEPGLEPPFPSADGGSNDQSAGTRASSPEGTRETDGTAAAPCVSPTTAHGDARKEAILDSAAELFADYGYHGASLRDISRRAGISHPGMLHHFESKEILLDAVIDRLEDHAQEALDGVDRLGADPQALLNGLIGIWHPASQTIQLLAMLTTDAVSEEHPGRYRMSRLRRVHEHVLENSFEQIAENGQLRDGIDPAFASRAFMDLVLGHAVREKTVRAMQEEVHHYSPIEDLTKLLRVFLQTS